MAPKLANLALQKQVTLPCHQRTHSILKVPFSTSDCFQMELNLYHQKVSLHFFILTAGQISLWWDTLWVRNIFMVWLHWKRSVYFFSHTVLCLQLFSCPPSESGSDCPASHQSSPVRWESPALSIARGMGHSSVWTLENCAQKVILFTTVLPLTKATWEWGFRSRTRHFGGAYLPLLFLMRYEYFFSLLRLLVLRICHEVICWLRKKMKLKE